MDTLGARFLNENDDSLSESKFVQLNAEKNDLLNSSPEEQIASWIDTVESIHTKHLDDEATMQRIKDVYHDRYVIKEEDFPESYFTNNERRAREQGYGDIHYTDDIKEEEIRIIQKNQRDSLDVWINYLTSEDSQYLPAWTKHWAFNGMLQLGRFNKETGAFEPRYKDTVAPFIELNPGALAYTAEVLQKKYGQKYFDITDKMLDANSRLKKATTLEKQKNIVKLVEEQGVDVKGKVIIYKDDNGKQRPIKRRDFEKMKEESSGYNGESVPVSEISKEIEELKLAREKVLADSGIDNNLHGESRGEDFGKLYAHAINRENFGKSELEIVDGEWVKYDQGSDHMKLYNSLYGKNTRWCTAEAESTAEAHLNRGDFYVYYSNNSYGKPVNPRIAIRMNGHKKIAEIRGVGGDQNLDLYMSESSVLEEKLKEFGNEGDKYRVKDADMKRVTRIEKQLEETNEISREDLRFIFEIDRDIEGFGHGRDPRVDNICNCFDKREALAYILECSEDDISFSAREVLERVTLFHYGDLDFSEEEDNYYDNDDDTWEDVFNDLILPKRVKGSLDISNVKKIGNVAFPEEVNGYLDLQNLKEHSGNILLPKKVDGYLSLSSLNSLEGVTLPSQISGDLDLGGLEKADGLIIPPDFHGLIILGVTTAENLVLPKKFGGSIKLRNLTNLDGLILPEEIDGEFDFSAVENVENFVAPQVKSVYSYNAKSLKNVDLSNVENNISFKTLVEADNVIFPEVAKGSINLGNLEKINNVTLPREVMGDFRLGKLSNFENLVLPEKIGEKFSLLTVELVENFVAPEVKFISFYNAKSLKNVDLSKVTGGIYLPSLTEVDNVIFPNTVDGNVDLRAIKDFRNISLPNVTSEYEVYISEKVFNDEEQMNDLRRRYPNTVFVSVEEEGDLLSEDLLKKIANNG